MSRSAAPRKRREDSLSRDRIVDAAIALLDGGGEAALTFRALAEQLDTGLGALYWHVADKGDLLAAACDAVVAQAVGQAVAAPANARSAPATPEAILRALALALYDAMDAHPWIGSALPHSAGQLPAVRILEPIGQQLCALGVPPKARWATASALFHYILGVGGQNAANSQQALLHGHDRDDYLRSVAVEWSQLDPAAYPFARAIAPQMQAHSDRADFLAGVDLLLAGIEASLRRRRA